MTGVVLAVVAGSVAVANSRGADDPTVATPSQSAGGAAAPSGGSPGGSAATAGASGATTAGAIDPALDPARIYGYRLTSTRTLVKVGPAVIIPADEQVGSIDRSFWRCLAGICKHGLWTFTAASPAFSQTDVENANAVDNRCLPATTTLAIARAPDGTYTGTVSVTPTATNAKWHTGKTFRACTFPQTSDAVSLEPVIKLAPDAAPDASLPAALDPVRITKYQGTSSADGKTTAATAACEGGVCQLPCFWVCATTVLVQAAAGTWSEEGLPTPDVCQGGTTSLKLVRAADGSYTGKATTTYVGKPRQGCATSTSFSLQPVTG